MANGPDLGEEVAILVGVMAQLRAWGATDSMMVELGVYNENADKIEQAEKLLLEKFKTTAKTPNPAHLSVGPALSRLLDQAIVTLYRIVTGQTKRYRDQWRLWGIQFSNREFEILVRALDIVRKERFDLEEMLKGRDFFSLIKKLIEEESQSGELGEK
jgi:hypothetical protein